jgi:hypothetical protein
MFDVTKPFKVEIEGRGALSLGPGDHVATGGEGHIFRAKKGKFSGLAIKVWDDPARAARDRMPDRLKILATLNHPSVVAPGPLVLDLSGRVTGFSMPFVDGGWAMPLAFTNDWRASQPFTTPDAIAFAAAMRETVRAVHSAHVVMGDANELNIIGTGGLPRYIDVDSWIPRGFTGDKILPTIRDWHSPAFSAEADWFAWAVTTFQLLVGIHPYRGTHPGFARSDFEGRMKAKASVFDTDVRLPAAVRPFSVIPPALVGWYRDVFMKGYRGLPPDPAAIQVAVTAAVTAPTTLSGGALEITDLYTIPAVALRTVAPGILLLTDGTLLNLADGRKLGRGDTKAAYIRLPDGSLASAKTEDGRVVFAVIRGTPGEKPVYQDSGIAAIAVWASANRLFAVVHDGLLELQAFSSSKGDTAVTGRKWSLTPDATAFGDGLALYDALGAKFLIAPFGQGAVAVIRVKDLDGLKPVAMLRRGRAGVMTLLDRKGGYVRAILVFSEDYSGCSLTLTPADTGDLSDVITDSGLILRFDSSGHLEASSPVTGAGRVADAGKMSTGRLAVGPAGVYCLLQGRVVKLGLR